MPKCIQCGRKGFFLKLQDGMCEACVIHLQELEQLAAERLAAAQKLYFEAKAGYELALQSDTVLIFTAFWDSMLDDINELRTFEGLIPDESYYEFMSVEHQKNEYQWRLRDAIERASKTAIADLRGDHRNNKRDRFAEFLDDLRSAEPSFSEETAEFAKLATAEVAKVAGIRPPVQSKPVQASNTLDASDTDKMDGAQFERWCADLLTHIGYSEVSLTGKSGDQGVDLLAQKDGVRYAIQCKCYSSDLGNTPIQEVNTGKVIYHCHVGAVMTNRRFTSGGQAAAEATGVLLWDRDWIENAIRAVSPVQETAAEETASTTSVVLNDSALASDPLLPVAVDIVLSTGQASVSTLQRRLKLGYAHAARIVDEMEALGIVGPFQGSKPRDILITQRQWDAIRPK